MIKRLCFLEKVAARASMAFKEGGYHAPLKNPGYKPGVKLIDFFKVTLFYGTTTAVCGTITGC